MGKGRARQQPQNHQTTHYLSSRSGITNPPVPNPHLPHHIQIYPSSIVKLINEFTHSGTSGLKSSHVLRPNPSHPPFTPSTNSTTFTNPTPHAPDHNKPIHSFTNPYGDIYITPKHLPHHSPSHPQSLPPYGLNLYLTRPKFGCRDRWGYSIQYGAHLPHPLSTLDTTLPNHPQPITNPYQIAPHNINMGFGIPN